MREILIYSTFLLLFCSTLHAQVLGVNTESPTRAVDINGKVRITGGNEKSNLNGITHLLAADSYGNIDKVPVPITPEIDKSLDVFSRVIILGGTNTPTTQISELQAGGFAFGVPSGVPSFRKLVGSGTSTSFTYGVKIMDRRSSGTGNTANNALQGGHSANSGDGRVYFRNYTKNVAGTMVAITDNVTTGTFNTFNSANASAGTSTATTVPKNRTNLLGRRDYYRVHLVHPDQPNFFYKVIFVRLQNGGQPLGLQANGYSALNPDTTWSQVGSDQQPDIWVITVERYNNQNN